MMYKSYNVHVYTCTRGSSFFLGKVTALGVLCCLCLVVCLTLLASFFLPSHLSLKHVYMYMYFKINRHRDETTQQFFPSLLTNQLSHCVQCHHGNKHRQLQQKVKEDSRPRVERESAHGRHHRNCSEKEGRRLGEPSEKKTGGDVSDCTANYFRERNLLPIAAVVFRCKLLDLTLQNERGGEEEGRESNKKVTRQVSKQAQTSYEWTKMNRLSTPTANTRNGTTSNTIREASTFM